MPLTGTNRGRPLNGMRAIAEWHRQNSTGSFDFHPRAIELENRTCDSDESLIIRHPFSKDSLESYKPVAIVRHFRPLSDALDFFNLNKSSEFTESAFHIFVARLAGYGPMVFGDFHPRNNAIINFFTYYWDSGISTTPMFTGYQFKDNTIQFKLNGESIVDKVTALNFQLVQKTLEEKFGIHNKYITAFELAQVIDELGYEKLFVAQG